MFENAGFFALPSPNRLDLIRRPKIKGPARHYGVQVWWSPVRTQVYDFQYTNEVRELTEEEFAERLPVTRVWSLVDRQDIAAAMDRWRQIVSGNWRYDPLKQNCEHVARYIVFGRVESPQVAGGWLIAGGIVAAIVLARG